MLSIDTAELHEVSTEATHTTSPLSSLSSTASLLNLILIFTYFTAHLKRLQQPLSAKCLPDLSMRYLPSGDAPIELCRFLPDQTSKLHVHNTKLTINKKKNWCEIFFISALVCCWNVRAFVINGEIVLYFSIKTPEQNSESTAIN